MTKSHQTLHRFFLGLLLGSSFQLPLNPAWAAGGPGQNFQSKRLNTHSNSAKTGSQNQTPTAANGSISTEGLSQGDYAKKVKITALQAQKISNDVVEGQILSTRLQPDRGFLVYLIEIANPASGIHKMLVDAGTGKMISDQIKDSFPDSRNSSIEGSN